MIIYNKLDNCFVVSADRRTFLGFEITANLRDTSLLKVTPPNVDMQESVTISEPSFVSFVLVAHNIHCTFIIIHIAAITTIITHDLLLSGLVASAVDGATEDQIRPEGVCSITVKARSPCMY